MIYFSFFRRDYPVSLYPESFSLQSLSEPLVKANVTCEEFTAFLLLVNTCWTSNFCNFDDQFFEFPDELGILIDSFLDSLVSEIFMNKFDCELFSSKHRLLPHFIYWHRYVDDVLYLWQGSVQQVSEFFLHLNRRYLSILSSQ